MVPASQVWYFAASGQGISEVMGGWRFQSEPGEQGCLLLEPTETLWGKWVQEAVCLEPPGHLLGQRALSGLGACLAEDPHSEVDTFTKQKGST